MNRAFVRSIQAPNFLIAMICIPGVLGSILAILSHRERLARCRTSQYVGLYDGILPLLIMLLVHLFFWTGSALYLWRSLEKASLFIGLFLVFPFTSLGSAVAIDFLLRWFYPACELKFHPG